MFPCSSSCTFCIFQDACYWGSVFAASTDGFRIECEEWITVRPQAGYLLGGSSLGSPQKRQHRQDAVADGLT